jgi:Acetyltransferase (GNAT) domain
MPGPFNLFHPYNPLIKSAPVFKKLDETNQRHLILRPLWIIGDLETLHAWMDSPNKKTNWNFNRKKNSVYRHYKEILLSGNAQSLIIEQDKQPVFQFDIFPLTNHDWPKDLDRKGGYSVNFLFVESFRDPDLFSRGIQMITEYLAAFDMVRKIYIKLMQPDFRMDERLRLTGFEFLQFSNFPGKPVPVYLFKMRASAV